MLSGAGHFDSGTTSVRRALIVGASLAGVNAAAGLRDRGFQGEVHLFGTEDEMPYTRPPLSKDALEAPDSSAESLALHEPGWYVDHGVDLHLGSAITAVDSAAKLIRDDRGNTHPYDGLIVATGCEARRLPAEILGEGTGDLVHTLRTVTDAARLRERLLPGTRVVVIGAGFIGLEVAATATKLGATVTVVDVAAAPLSRVFGDAIGHWFTALHARHGVDVRCSTSVARVERRGAGAEVTFTDGERLPADLIVAGIGGRPAVDWLAGSGVDTDCGVVCQPDLSTSVPGVVAAGDLAIWHNATFDQTMRVEHWTNAVEQGRHSAGRLLGDRTPFSSIPYFWTDQFGAKLRFVGRAAPDDDVVVEQQDDKTLVALFGRHGKLRGAVCVNAPRKLAKYRTALDQSAAWADVACTA